MENDILDTLEDIGYQGPLLDDGILEQELEKGPTSVEFTKLIEWLTKELGTFYGIDDCVNAISSAEDADTFLMELSGFLREYGCPHDRLCEGPITERLALQINKVQLIDFLLTELQAARMTAVNKPNLLKKTVQAEEVVGENETAKYLKTMLIALGFPKPPDGITAFQLFTKLEAKVKELVGKVYPAHLSKPILKARLSEKQWKDIEFINSVLRQDYECRREMMLKRLDVTIQSFRWSDRAKQKDDQLAAVYQPIRRQLQSKVVTDIPHLLAARDDLLNIDKTSSGKSREKTKCDLNRILIGLVPDRGGRAYEHQVPPPEMPSFMQRQSQPQRGGWGRGGQQRQGRGQGGYWQNPKRGRFTHNR